MLAYRVRREFETKDLGTLRVGDILDSELASSFKNLDSMVKTGLLVIAETDGGVSEETTPKKGKRK